MFHIDCENTEGEGEEEGNAKKQIKRVRKKNDRWLKEPRLLRNVLRFLSFVSFLFLILKMVSNAYSLYQGDSEISV